MARATASEPKYLPRLLTLLSFFIFISRLLSFPSLSSASVLQALPVGLRRLGCHHKQGRIYSGSRKTAPGITGKEIENEFHQKVEKKQALLPCFFLFIMAVIGLLFIRIFASS